MSALARLSELHLYIFARELELATHARTERAVRDKHPALLVRVDPAGADCVPWSEGRPADPGARPTPSSHDEVRTTTTRRR